MVYFHIYNPRHPNGPLLLAEKDYNPEEHILWADRPTEKAVSAEEPVLADVKDEPEVKRGRGRPRSNK